MMVAKPLSLLILIIVEAKLLKCNYAKRNEKPSDDNLKIITKDDYQNIIERFPLGDTFYLAIQIAYHTGLRSAEVCGLTLDNIDFVNKTLTVDKIYNYVGKGRNEFGPPKTTTSSRTIQRRLGYSKLATTIYTHT
jgi:integrase